MFPANFMPLIMMMLGTIVFLTSCHWLMMWMDLELHLTGIPPL